MAAKGAPIDGRNTRVEMLLNGVPQEVPAQCTNFECEAVFTTIESKLIGQSGKDLDQDPEGWKGSMDLDLKSAAGDRMINAYVFAKSQGLPVSLQIVDTTIFRDRSSITHVYPEVQIGFSRSVKRGSPVSAKVTWMTGKDRYAL